METKSESLSLSGSSCFVDLIAPLEAYVGHVLNGFGRQKCLAAYHESPAGFEHCCDQALERATSNPLGLLVRMVLDGDHLAAGPPLEYRHEIEARRPFDDCMVCRRRRELWEAEDGRLLCERCKSKDERERSA